VKVISFQLSLGWGSSFSPLSGRRRAHLLGGGRTCLEAARRLLAQWPAGEVPASATNSRAAVCLWGTVCGARWGLCAAGGGRHILECGRGGKEGQERSTNWPLAVFAPNGNTSTHAPPENDGSTSTGVCHCLPLLWIGAGAELWKGGKQLPGSLGSLVWATLYPVGAQDNAERPPASVERPPGGCVWPEAARQCKEEGRKRGANDKSELCCNMRRVFRHAEHFGPSGGHSFFAKTAKLIVKQSQTQTPTCGEPQSRVETTC